MFDKDWIEQNTIPKFLAAAEGKKVVFWGAGIEANRAMENELADISPGYFCDSNEAKWGAKFHGFDIKPPEALLEENRDALVVVICCRFFLLSEIIEQLEELSVPCYFSSCLFVPENTELFHLRFKGEYCFDDRRKHHKKLLYVLAGYKPFLWDVVFARIAAVIPDDLDTCLVLSGVQNDYLRKLAEKQGWSYVSTKENKLSLAQNIAIMLHNKAEMIFKLDEDIFIGKDYFTRMEASYKKIESTEMCRIGCLSPLLPVNVYSYIPFLQKMGLEEQYMKRFGAEAKEMGGWALHWKDDVVKFLWEHSLPFDKTAEQFWADKTDPVTCPYRFSIGAILFHRRLWEQMFGFDVGLEGEMGNDEVHICNHCMEQFLAIYIDTNILAGHFAYGAQTELMRDYFEKNKARFNIGSSGVPE